ncbi:hypothetical protein A176_007295 [Myxococcus hansupus]|uniref:Uncharacterized protein n=1 Tax=Pseudomyxococcus hansupus TaxID=1297742 RepID=A0A0H4X8R0_9BACT|nr:hypothetical protein [Myxococcus hansupus]AKQ70383.1 hypothetical protein A176_007295 [Myxococcus hansupus]
MSKPEFELHLGGGLYLDSQGNIRQGAPPPKSVPVFEVPFQLPLEPSKLKDTVAKVEKALKSVTKDPEVIAMFARFGYASKLLDVLSAVTKVAAMIAPVLSVAAFAYDILKLFGLFKSTPSSFEKKVMEAVAEITDTQRVIFAHITETHVTGAHSRISTWVAGVMDYFTSLQNSHPSLQDLKDEYNKLESTQEERSGDVQWLLTDLTWRILFPRADYSRVWGFMSDLVHTMPAAAGQPPVKTPFPANNSLVFDHRLMTPLVLFASEAYLTAIRAIRPEHRVIGTFHNKLLLMADALERCAQQMRSDGLGRTVYAPSHFTRVRASDVIPGRPFTGAPVISPRCSRWPVGALDLRRHSDSYFNTFLNDLSLAETRGNVTSSRFGGLDFRWIPPAVLGEHQEPWGWEILNPDECAAAANAQSEADYAELLATSGYVELLRVVALLRNEATEPSSSMTASQKRMSLFRAPLPAESVAIKSGGSGWVKETVGTGKRESQNWGATLALGTQPLNRAYPLKYNIVLRTLVAGASYEDYYRTSYVPEPDRPSALALAIDTVPGVLLDEFYIFKNVESPREAVGLHDRQRVMTAATFDWWIQVATPFSLDNDFLETAVELGTLGFIAPVGGGSAGDRLPDGTPGTGASVGMASWLPGGLPNDVIGTHTPFIGWKPGVAELDGQRREPKVVPVTVKYRIDWLGDDLRMEFRNVPQDRNYVVHVVLEEFLPRTGKWLHTAIPVPINGCLTFIPQRFFEEEAKAVANAGQAIAVFYKRQFVDVAVGRPPPDPKFDPIRPGDLVSLNQVVSLGQSLERLGFTLEMQERDGGPGEG